MAADERSIDDELRDAWAAMSDPDDDECHTCEGQGWGIVGCHFGCRDYVNGPYDGDVARCPNCGGTGRRRDGMVG